MTGLLQFFLGVWFLGGVVSLFVFSARCGLCWNVGKSIMSAWMHVPSRRNGLPWIFLALGKTFARPVVLGMWLRDGRPPPSLLFHQRAAAVLGRPARELAYSQRGFATKWSLSNDGPPQAY